MRAAGLVTPFVGVWIETTIRLEREQILGSHPSWVCGLKLLVCRHNTAASWSHPSWVCGLKHLKKCTALGSAGSHPSWVCGLKPYEYQTSTLDMSSHPSWVCGLKHVLVVIRKRLVKVTPFVGVWIETCRWSTWCYSCWVTPFVGVWIETLSGMYKSETSLSHTLRGCVD